MRLISRMALTCALVYVAVFTAQAVELTVYDGDFAVVHDRLPVDLVQGTNKVVVSDIPALLEPYSIVVNADPTAGVRVVQVEFPGKIATPDELYSQFAGTTISFLQMGPSDSRTVEGKILRGPISARGMPVVIESNGRIYFDAPGKPQFPQLPDGVSLSPRLTLTLDSKQAGHTELDITYVTRGISWQADYNAVLTEQGGVELTAWMTLTNTCGKSFEKARLKLANAAERPDRTQRPGDEVFSPQDVYQSAAYGGRAPRATTPLPAVRTDFQYFTLEEPARVTDGSPSRVQFVRCQQSTLTPIYVYDGWKPPTGFRPDYPEGNQRYQNYGTDSRKEVSAMGEFSNAVNGAPGPPMPAGKLHLFRRVKDQLDFLGDDKFGPVPANGKMMFFVGNAGGFSGARRQSAFKDEPQRTGATESIEIALKNDTAKEEAIRVIEHLFRGKKWEITESSDAYQKLPDGTVEFRVQVKPSEEKKLTYTAHYTW